VPLEVAGIVIPAPWTRSLRRDRHFVVVKLAHLACAQLSRRVLREQEPSLQVGGSRPSAFTRFPGTGR
jgi:hypothetical protein